METKLWTSNRYQDFLVKFVDLLEDSFPYSFKEDYAAMQEGVRMTISQFDTNRQDEEEAEACVLADPSTFEFDICYDDSIEELAPMILEIIRASLGVHLVTEHGCAGGWPIFRVVGNPTKVVEVMQQFGYETADILDLHLVKE